MWVCFLGVYCSQYFNLFWFYIGQIVEVGVCDEEWLVFVWVCINDGCVGWVFIVWLQLLDEGCVEVLCDYDVCELDVESGEMVKFYYEYGGWWWFECVNGVMGWLLVCELELLEENCK